MTHEMFEHLVNSFIRAGTEPCHCAGGNGTCYLCHGLRVIEPEEYSEYVVSGVLGSVIFAAVMMRDDNRFSDMNFLLDEANAWMVRGRQPVDSTTPEQVEKFLEAFGVFEAGFPTAQVHATTNALSESELRELGLLDEEGST